MYDATAWLQTHPGGMRTILSNSGRDSTAVLLAMHDPNVLENALRRMRKVGLLDTTMVDGSFQVNGHAEEKKEENITPRLTRLSAAETKEKEESRKRTAAMERDFLQLDDWLAREGWYQPAPRDYGLAVLRALTILVLGVGLTRWGASDAADNNYTESSGQWHSILALITGSALIGFFFQQIAFLGHDAGHGSITGDFADDGILGLVVGNALAGIDFSWWKSTHNVHHGATNSIHDDPDIQHLPIFCFEVEMVQGAAQEGTWSTYHGRFMSAGAIARNMMRFQHVYFYPVMAFARVNLYIQSIIHLIRICPFGVTTDRTSAPTKRCHDGKSETPYEWPTATPTMWIAQVGSLAINYTLWYMLLSSLDFTAAAICLVVSHGVAGILHVQILLSHVAMQYHRHHHNSDDNDVGFHEIQALTTMDIACHPSMDWIHGGLQFQLEHHLFPRVPKFRLRKIIPLVDAIFAKYNVPVVRKSFAEGNIMLLRHMQRVGNIVSRTEAGTCVPLKSS